MQQNSAVSLTENLALVQACLAGDEAAWERFITRYRPMLYSAALAMCRDSCIARELADSLWAELYGTRTDGSGHRLSKLTHYTGRGSLEGWLRTLLAQELVDRYRKASRLVALEDNLARTLDDPENLADSTSAPLNLALESAVAELAAESRLILAAHYLDARTLAEIGCMLGIHESTVSRRLNKAVRFLRKRTIHHLRRSGIGMQQATELMAVDVRQISMNLRDCLQPVKDGL
jgi:RNA polymerase sigma-70 factor (ECF subfamily)